MGPEYLYFRSIYEIKRKTGILKSKFPTDPDNIKLITLEEWKKNSAKFFFRDRESITIEKIKNPTLKEEAENLIFRGIIKYFNSINIEIKGDYDWITNPENNYQYDINKHWSEIDDFSKAQGDIKYVWEKSRFSFLYTVIRYDYHFSVDCSEYTFREINSWMDHNPINRGPNYKCSQEISIRILNWIFALYYYRNSIYLTEEIFQKIVNSIYWQLCHVYNNINFSRKTVRNNHAITETMTLFLCGVLFPFLPDSQKWKEKGRKWFEKEVSYQIYEDGTFLQFSMNYHRVVIQLLTWAIILSEKNNERLSSGVYERAQNSVSFLYSCQDDKTGNLPNYGANDGALFFKLNDNEYRDYRPQINALYYWLNKKNLYDDLSSGEDVQWYNSDYKSSTAVLKKNSVERFPKGGYYVINDQDTLTFIRCGNHKDRPSHADNLHLDLWYKGKNILRDAGSYKYNSGADDIKYFNGSESHNTVMLESYDQMEKGPRFIWLNWTQAVSAELSDTDKYVEFEGKIKAFRHIGSNITHKRKVKKNKNKHAWEIIDELDHNTGYQIRQLWHPSDDFFELFTINAFDENNLAVHPVITDGWYSGLYGVKEKCKQITYTTQGKKITTIISIK
jgi:hypothetical protein